MQELPIVVAIDTDSDSTSFARPMCAFITGMYGECCVGQGIADFELSQGNIRSADWYFDHVVDRIDPDDWFPCQRPCSSWPTQGYFNDGMGGYYKDNEDIAEVLARYVKRVEAYENSRVEHAKTRIRELDFEEEPGWTEEACLEEVKRVNMNIAAAIKRTQPYRFPAHCSVAIFVDEVPPAKVLAEMLDRAKLFAATRPDGWKTYAPAPFKVTGVRVLIPKMVGRKIDHEEIAGIQT